ncbi:transposase [Runella sp.]|jgi:putative transposase|uniref:REP-associated tyrosine transposase n=1 Tax=Runella sp. TaxID=1960881 RepID=UPI00260699A2|nr:transposase [Runella sp.]
MRRTTYSSEINFLTLTVVHWVDVFTRVEYKDFLIRCLRHCQQNKGLEIYAYVLMTNHLHLIARSTTQDLSWVLRDLKTFSSKELVKMIQDNPQESRKGWMLPIFFKSGVDNPKNKYHQFWENENYPTALWSPTVIQQKIDYIHENPVKAGIVNEPHEYFYSSANPLSPLKVNEM